MPVRQCAHNASLRSRTRTTSAPRGGEGCPRASATTRAKLRRAAPRRVAVEAHVAARGIERHVFGALVEARPAEVLRGRDDGWAAIRAARSHVHQHRGRAWRSPLLGAPPEPHRGLQQQCARVVGRGSSESAGTSGWSSYWWRQTGCHGTQRRTWSVGRPSLRSISSSTRGRQQVNPTTSICLKQRRAAGKASAQRHSLHMPLEREACEQPGESCAACKGSVTIVMATRSR